MFPGFCYLPFRLPFRHGKASGRFSPPPRQKKAEPCIFFGASAPAFWLFFQAFWLFLQGIDPAFLAAFFCCFFGAFCANFWLCLALFGCACWQVWPFLLRLFQGPCFLPTLAGRFFCGWTLVGCVYLMNIPFFLVDVSFSLCSRFSLATSPQCNVRPSEDSWEKSRLKTVTQAQEVVQTFFVWGPKAYSNLFVCFLGA